MNELWMYVTRTNLAGLLDAALFLFLVPRGNSRALKQVGATSFISFRKGGAHFLATQDKGGSHDGAR
jgi:hypothetical protein